MPKPKKIKIKRNKPAPPSEGEVPVFKGKWRKGPKKKSKQKPTLPENPADKPTADKPKPAPTPGVSGPRVSQGEGGPVLDKLNPFYSRPMQGMQNTPGAATQGPAPTQGPADSFMADPRRFVRNPDGTPMTMQQVMESKSVGAPMPAGTGMGPILQAAGVNPTMPVDQEMPSPTVFSPTPTPPQMSKEQWAAIQRQKQATPTQPGQLIF